MCRCSLLFASVLVLIVGCDSEEPGAPDASPGIRVSITGGADQIGLPGTLLEQALSIQLMELGTARPVREREVFFRAETGSGIAIVPERAFTDLTGAVAVQVRLGERLGRHAIEVAVAGQAGQPGRAIVETALIPLITAVTPGAAQSGDVIRITGEHFGGQPDWNEVHVDQTRATIVQATSTELQARLPRCMASGTAQLRVIRGALQSEAVPVAVSGTAPQPVTLRAGETTEPLDDPRCVRVNGIADSALYLVIPINGARELEYAMGMQLVGGSGGEVVAGRARAIPPARADAGVDFEARLRQREDAMVARAQPRIRNQPPSAAQLAPPRLGDRRDFNVLGRWFGVERVSAVARAMTHNVILYVDVEAEGPGNAELFRLAQSFDDPIFTTVSSVFGETSDIDGNGRVAVLISPAVNRLTPPGSNGYIAGYFYGCDLLDVVECPDSNQGEVLYSIAPDPTGQNGLRHSRAAVIAILPSVLAHELQHLVHFNRRVLVGGSATLDALWLSEALAHSAEDTVASVLRSRGDTAAATRMNRDNYIRAAYYLEAPERTTLVSVFGGGSLEERGAGWLFLKYLRHRLGGDLLKRLTEGQARGSENINAASGVAWATLLRDWAVALYAAGAPELNGAPLPSAHTFGDFDLRNAIGSVASGHYPLVPTRVNGGDFTLDLTVAASSGVYLLVPAAPDVALDLTLGGAAGQPFTMESRPDLVIFRLR